MASTPQLSENLPGKLRSVARRAMEDEDDQELLRRFAEDHDELAFEVIVRRHGPMVLGVCQRIMNHRQDAEDAFQATFLVLVQKASSLRKPELLANWLYGVACRIARKTCNRETRRAQQEPSAMSTNEAGSDPTTQAEWRELLSVMDEELQQLPSKYRQPLVLCYLSNMTNEEAAQRLGVPVGSMSYRLGRARQMLQERLERRNQSLPAGFFAGVAFSQALPEVSGNLISATVSLAKGLSTSVPVPSSAPAVELAHTALQAMAREKKQFLILSTLAVLLATFGLSIIVTQFLAGELWQGPPNDYYVIKGSSVPASVFSK